MDDRITETALSLTKFGVGQPVRRSEDPTLVRGQGRYTDDVSRPNQAYAVMIVREVTPPGSFGKVFGFVTTGFNIGGIVSPLIFGAVMDHGSPRMVFLLVAAFTLLGIVTVAARPRRIA